MRRHGSPRTVRPVSAKGGTDRTARRTVCVPRGSSQEARMRIIRNGLPLALLLVACAGESKPANPPAPQRPYDPIGGVPRSQPAISTPTPQPPAFGNKPQDQQG